MKIALPTANGLLCSHFGHCQQFMIIEVDSNTKSIIESKFLTPPAHEPGAFPAWLSGMGCDVIIAGGIGGRAVDLFQQNGIQVIMGAPNKKPEEVVLAYLNGDITTGSNPCDDPDFHEGDHEGCSNN